LIPREACQNDPGCVHSPSYEAKDDQKDTFYNELNSFLKDVPRSDILDVRGGVYMRTVATMETIVPKSWATMGLEDTKQIEVQAEMAQPNKLIVGGTFSVHKNIDKYSWTSPDKRTRNQINHFLISKKWQTLLCDVRTFECTDIFSYHSLTVAKIKVKLSDP